MPTLFISYKRDDKVAVTKISERLNKDFYFDIWIDAVSIPGGKDWREEIRKGIDKADILLLMLTPDACASEQVKEEVDYAKSIGRKILPLQIKRVTDDDLKNLGVETLNYIDFNTSHDDRFAWEKLLNDLPDVLERDKRLLDPKFKALHQDYLRSLFTRYGKLSLSYLLDATPKERVSLFDVYVPLKLGVSFNIETMNGDFVDWWIRDQNSERRSVPDDEMRELSKPKSLNGFAPNGTAWVKWEAQMREEWINYKENYEKNQADKPEKDRQPLADGTYYWRRIESEVAPALMSRIVITGAPGGGKSTLLRHLALCMAGDMLATGDESQADLNKLGFWPLPAYTPIFVELRALVRTAFPDPKTTVTLEKFFSYIETEQLKPHSISSYLDDLRAQLRDGDVMIFLDGLDEVPDADTDERREQIKSLAHLLSSQYPKCRICITSRPYAYAGDWQLDGFGQVTLTNLDPDRLEELALRLFRVVLGQEGAEQEAEAFKKQMEKVPEDLRGSPLFFTLLASIWLNNTTKPNDERIPISEGAIYRECVEMLIRRWTQKDAESGQSLLDDIGLNETNLRDILQALAYSVHHETGDHDDAEFTGGRIMDIVRQLKLKRVDIDGLCNALSQRAGVIYERAPNRYQFAHRSFQEHLAACYLVGEDHYPQTIVDHLQKQPNLWRNVVGLLIDEAKRQKRDLWQFVKLLLPVKDAELPATADHPLWTMIFHASHLMRDHLPDHDDLQELYRPRLRQSLVALIQIGGLAPVDRAEMGQVLSELGDPRQGVGVVIKNGIKLPDIEWVTIPAGAFTYQGGKMPLNYDFQIARYPVTYIQFQAFVDDPDGWHDPRWWKGLSIPDGHNKTVGDQAFKYNNHPRERVSWYDAMAFCRWYSWRLGGGYDLDAVNQWTVRLPTEFEWEKTARGKTGWAYPYSDTFDPLKGNTHETGIRQTSAVGLFSAGDARHWDKPIADLSGNVWEWCLTDYGNPQTNAGQEDLRSDARRVLRGGSWSFDSYSARAVYRGYGNPRLRGDSNGFRVVRVPSHLAVH